MKNLAEKIKNLRVQKRLSQEEVADKIKLNQSSYYKVESGKTEISVQRLYDIAEALGVTAFELLGNETTFTEQEKGLESRILELEGRIRDKDRIIKNFEERLEENSQNNERSINELIGEIIVYTAYNSRVGTCVYSTNLYFTDEDGNDTDIETVVSRKSLSSQKIDNIIGHGGFGLELNENEQLIIFKKIISNPLFSFFIKTYLSNTRSLQFDFEYRFLAVNGSYDHLIKRLYAYNKHSNSKFSKSPFLTKEGEIITYKEQERHNESESLF